jgi:hypothetical protein
MSLSNAGLSFITSAIIGAAVTPFNNANAYIGVGDGTEDFAKEQTDLAGTEKIRKKVSTGFPTVDGNKMVFKTIFDSTEANFSWKEWGVFNAETGGIMFNRKVEDNGEKNGGTWAFTVEIELVN